LLTYERHLAQLEVTAAGFAAVLGTADLDAPVAACPGWTVRDLAWHLGGVHNWASYALREDGPGEETHEGPSQRDELVAWYRECADGLLAALRSTDPARPRWTFGPPPRVAGFWFRRQAQETTVHLWDAHAAAGAPQPVAVDVAQDGIDELVRIFFPRQVRLKRCEPLSTSLALVATDGDELRWRLAGDGLPVDALAADATSVDDAAVDDALVDDATVTGPTEALLLLLWNRIGLDDPRLAVDERSAADAVLSRPIRP
jgi:uncharacterized protein (TIGR03083 family)